MSTYRIGSCGPNAWHALPESRARCPTGPSLCSRRLHRRTCRPRQECRRTPCSRGNPSIESCRRWRCGRTLPCWFLVDVSAPISDLRDLVGLRSPLSGDAASVVAGRVAGAGRTLDTAPPAPRRVVLRAGGACRYRTVALEGEVPVGGRDRRARRDELAVRAERVVCVCDRIVSARSVPARVSVGRGGTCKAFLARAREDTRRCET